MVGILISFWGPAHFQGRTGCRFQGGYRFEISPWKAGAVSVSSRMLKKPCFFWLVKPPKTWNFNRVVTPKNHWVNTQVQFIHGIWECIRGYLRCHLFWITAYNCHTGLVSDNHHDTSAISTLIAMDSSTTWGKLAKYSYCHCKGTHGALVWIEHRQYGPLRSCIFLKIY